MYAYAGEFFADAFKNCGNEGVYKQFEKRTGIGFAPYIYHGLEYKVFNNLSFDVGLILPTLFVSSFKISF